MCDKLLAEDFVTNAEDIVNMTGTIVETEDFFENVYNVFDDLLLVTKITQKLHPIAFHCWYAGEHTYKHFYDVIVLDNGYNPKNYILNVVYNFGHIFDAIRDVYLFFAEDPRGQLNDVHDAGFSAGLALFYVITPGLAIYESTSVHYRSSLNYEDTGFDLSTDGII
jgi:hypothetical protein